MKGKLLIVLFYLPASLLAQPNTWMQRDSVKGPQKSACVAFSAYTSGFVGLGFDLTENKRSFYRYDQSFDDWDQVQSLGNATGAGLERSSAVAFSIYNKGYVGLGSGFVPYFDDFWMYDPATDVWTQMADFGGTARTMAVAFSIDSLGYVGTGKDAAGLKNDFWKYSPATNTWTQVMSFPGTARKLAVGVSMGGYGYVGTGDDGTFKNDFFRYNPASNSWAPIANFGGTARYGACGFARYPSLMVGTGYDNTLNYKNDFWEYNFWSGVWIQRASIPTTPRSNAVAFTIGQSGYVGTGYDGDLCDDFYEYTFPLGMDEVAVNTEIKIYPNPASHVVWLTSAGVEMQTLKVFDTQGKCVWQDADESNHRMQWQIPVYQLHPGTYICEVIGRNGEIIRQRLVVLA